MPYRLIIELGDRVQRFPLDDGEHGVGSAQESRIRISHPTVSRRHALVSVSGDLLSIQDLGSRNGTRVEGREIDARAVITPGLELKLGSVRGRIEEVPPGDLDAGVTLPMRPSEDLPVSESAPSTVGPGVLEAFTLRHLPELAESLARRAGRMEIVQAVGSALFRSLPCHSVEIGSFGSIESLALLFEARRGSDAEVTPVEVDAGEGSALRVGFAHPALARTYRPLVDAAGSLVRAAGGRRKTARRSSPRPPSSARPPSPPSVVPRMRRIYEEAARVAASRVSVLIRGESGTGKELLARYLHAASDRTGSRLVTLNCAALPRDLLEAELFGVERGVATGVEARAGKFEAADGSTLFLDEIGDMALETQARILRVLQEGEVYRVGSHRARPVDLRVISATNRDLDALLDQGLFRRDLYHRIADWIVELPPLRERRADVPNLAAHFLSHAAEERGIRAAGISRAALEALRKFDWPGNVRQLEREMERAALFLEDGELLDTSRLQSTIVDRVDLGLSDSLQSVRENAERAHICRVLEECDYVFPRAAERLEIGLSTLYAKLKSLAIEPTDPDKPSSR